MPIFCVWRLEKMYTQKLSKVQKDYCISVILSQLLLALCPATPQIRLPYASQKKLMRSALLLQEGRRMYTIAILCATQTQNRSVRSPGTHTRSLSGNVGNQACPHPLTRLRHSAHQNSALRSDRKSVV